MNSFLQNFIKNNLCKVSRRRARDRDRDETWDLRDRDFKKRVSRLRPSLETPSLPMSCRIRAVEHQKCAAGLSNTHPSLQDRILLNYTRIENAHEVRKKTFNFCCTEV